jgi:hypothetical protein
MNKRTPLLILFPLPVLFGCDDTVIQPDATGPSTNVAVTLDWAELDRLTAMSSRSVGDFATHALDLTPINRVGVRVEYPNEDAVFMQTVDRETAATSGVITMVLPPTSHARLFVLAVHEYSNQGGSGEAKAMAYLDLGRLVPGKALKLTTNSLGLIPATWELEAPYEYTLGNGELRLEIEAETDVRIGLVARDPFGDVSARTGTRRFIELNGSGSLSLAANGTRSMTQVIHRNQRAAGTTTTAQFFPYFNGALFNFGGAARFSVPPVGRATVTWQDPIETP